MPVRKLAAAAVGTIALLALTDAAFAQMAEVKKYCGPDIERLCPGVQPGGGRIIKCLKANEMGISVGCAKTLKKMKSQM